jgi:hypothetical protein
MAAADVVQRRWLRGHGPEGHRGVLGHRPLAEDRVPDRAEHLVPHRSVDHAGTDGVHRARPVHPGDQRESVLHPPLQVALEDGVVEGIDPGRGHRDPDLSLSGLGHGQIDDRSGLAQRLDGERSHRLDTS